MLPLTILVPAGSRADAGRPAGGHLQAASPPPADRIPGGSRVPPARAIRARPPPATPAASNPGRQQPRPPATPAASNPGGL